MSVIDAKPNPNISTFSPLDQQVGSNIRYNGNGYMPCNGYVPCQVRHLLKTNSPPFVLISLCTFPLKSWRKDWMGQCRAITTMWVGSTLNTEPVPINCKSSYYVYIPFRVMGMHQLVVGNWQELNLLRISEDKSSILSTNHHKAPSYTDLPKYISPKHDVFHHFLLVVNCLYCTQS